MSKVKMIGIKEKIIDISSKIRQICRLENHISLTKKEKAKKKSESKTFVISVDRRI